MTRVSIDEDFFEKLLRYLDLSTKGYESLTYDEMNEFGDLYVFLEDESKKFLKMIEKIREN